MKRKYEVLLLHLNLFTQTLHFNGSCLSENNLFWNMCNTDLLEELYDEYKLYLVGDIDLSEMLTVSHIFGILPYMRDLFLLQSEQSLDRIMQQVHLTNPEACLLCGRNPEQEIMLANRYGMDSCYVGSQSNLRLIQPTYQVYEINDIKKILKLH